MQTWETIWSFRTPRFKVTLDCTWDDDVDLPWDDTGETAEKITSGEWELCGNLGDEAIRRRGLTALQ